MHLWSPNKYLRCFLGYTNCGKKCESHNIYISQMNSNTEKFCFSFYTVKITLFAVYSVPCYLHCLIFCSFCCLTWPSSVGLKLLRPSSLWHNVRGKHLYWIRFIQAWAMVLFSRSSKLNQKHVLKKKKASLNRNAQKHRLHMDWLVRT